jgi:hypothetical protein
MKVRYVPASLAGTSYSLGVLSLISAVLTVKMIKEQPWVFDRSSLFVVVRT